MVRLTGLIQLMMMEIVKAAFSGKFVVEDAALVKEEIDLLPFIEVRIQILDAVDGQKVVFRPVRAGFILVVQEFLQFLVKFVDSVRTG